MIEPLHILGRRIGPGEPAYIVAELSANHGQRFERAVRLIELAKQAGADAVKLQTYTPDTITLRSQRDCFRVDGGTPWDGRTLHDLYAEGAMPWEWQPRLKRAAEELGLALFSSPFDAGAVDFLEGMEAPAYKIASFELVDIPLIAHAARTGKPMILSTGMATLAEVDEAVAAARTAGAREIALLHCHSGYPAPLEEMNLPAIPMLRDRYGVPVGLSDHSAGGAAAVAAVALGASLIEKHFIESRAAGGLDAAFSLEPEEFARMAAEIRAAERALQPHAFGPREQERASLRFRRSLFVVRPVRRGEAFTAENLRSIRPADGLHPRHLQEVLGCRATCDLEAGMPLRPEHVHGMATHGAEPGLRH